MGAAHTMQELKQFQAMPLEVKIAMTKVRVRDWVNYFGVNGVYISFSGGKDSTVLLHIVRELYPDVPAVFVDTGLEYPEIRDFVKTFDNVVILRPKMNFRKVIETYGYPLISKEVSGIVANARRFLEEPEKYKERERLPVQKEGEAYKPYALIQLEGGLENSIFNQEKWRFLTSAPFAVNNKCCFVMKKDPVKKYQKETGRKPITGQMAEESRMRTAVWLRRGCNAFEGNQISNPMSFWTEQDVLKYIKQNKIKIASVYGDIVPMSEGEFTGQMDISDYGLVEDNRPLKTTMCDRTGCMFCGYGCHMKDDKRFLLIKQTHPQIYDYIMRPWSEGGLDYKAVIDWLNEHGNLNIKY